MLSVNRLRMIFVLLGAVALTLGLITSGATYQQSEVIDSGPVVTWSNQFLNLAVVLLGLMVVGRLIVSGFLTQQDGKFLNSDSQNTVRETSKLSLSFAFVCVVGAITTLATVLGLKFSQACDPRIIQTYLWDLSPARSLLMSAGLASLVAFGARISKSLNSVAGLTALSLAAVAYPLLNSHSASLGNHSLAITASVAHGLSMSVWVGSVLAIYPFINSGEIEVANRFSKLASVCIALLLVSGIVSAATRMASISDLFTSGYGQLVLIKVALFCGIGICAIKIRKALVVRSQSTSFVISELLIMALAIGVGVALHFTPPTRAAIPNASAAEDLLGFNFPPAPSASNLLLGWYPDWLFLTIGIFAGALYFVGLLRLHRSEISWPFGRTFAFYFGLSLMIWVTCAGIAKYAMITFSAHMIQHMILAMLVPIFLVLGAPITLALRALPTSASDHIRTPRGWIVSLLHSTYVQLISNPIVVLFVFSVSLYGIYFTSLFASMMGSHIGHIAMSLHFLATGLIFSYLIIGIDPAPKRVPYWGKLLMVLVSLSIHAFFALAIMQTSTPLGDTWYRQVRPPWLTDPLADTHLAGGIAWGIGELPMLILLIVVAVQWSRSDTRAAVQRDRAADRDQEAELTAYNQRLAELNLKFKNEPTE